MIFIASKKYVGTIKQHINLREKAAVMFECFRKIFSLKEAQNLGKAAEGGQEFEALLQLCEHGKK